MICPGILGLEHPDCGVLFHPWRGREVGPQRQRYCCNDCSRAFGTFTRSGRWPEPIQQNLSTTTAGPSVPFQSRPPDDDALLGYPPVGAAARAVWCAAGERRAAEADKRLHFEASRGNGRTIILAGQGSYLGVEDGALIVHQGRTHGAPAPAKERLYPGVHGVRRIFWVGRDLQPSGTLTLAALTFCRREDIQLALLDGAGEPLLSVSPDAPSDTTLRRAQYRVADTGQEIGIVRELLRRKLSRQRETVQMHPELPGRGRALDALNMALAWLDLDTPTPYLSTPEGLLVFEARCARAYWAAWSGLPLHWEQKARCRVPPHWLAVRERVSPLAPTRNARHAVDPANAVLNYAYGCLESQTRQALTIIGFDLSCGLLHSEKAGRESLVYDLMEAERGAVDSLVLTFLGTTLFRAGDFTRMADGSCRLHPQLARGVVAVCRVSQDRVDEHARWLRDAVRRSPVHAEIVPAVPVAGYRHTGTTQRRPRTRQTDSFGQYV